MASKAGDLWSEIMGCGDEEEDNRSNYRCFHSEMMKPLEAEITVVVCSGQKSQKEVVDRRPSWNSISGSENPLCLVPAKRVSWNRSLSTRGRTSIAAAIRPDYLPEKRKSKRKPKPPLPRGKNIQPPNYDKEIAYFKEVDSFELLEESPSPKKPNTWIMGIQPDQVTITNLSSVLQKWLIAQNQRRGRGPPYSLRRILETPGSCKEPMFCYGLEPLSLKPSGEAPYQIDSQLNSIQKRMSFGSVSQDFSRKSQRTCETLQNIGKESDNDIEEAVGKLSLSSRSDSLDAQSWDPFSALLTACGQSAPATLSDVLVTYCDPKYIVKVGEGTFGEAFKAGETVCKIVPFDGTLLVNGEVQKRSEELLEEVMLSGTLNHLRDCEDQISNASTSFIRTVDLRVCRGTYDAALIKAWEEWDEEHGSENDHPKEFPGNQCYVVFVQEHGGQDLESFVLSNFDEARSLLVQVTLALAVAEAAYEFEHRDLHWGNILLTRKASETMYFTLEGRKINVKTYGLAISIIDFSLSRLKTGEDILFLDLSLDPELFEGPKGDSQFDTYRKMKVVTDECWEGSFPKTNVLWLQYLVDILLLKKPYPRTSKDERDLRYLKKRLNSYGSAKEASADPFFSELFVDQQL